MSPRQHLLIATLSLAAASAFAGYELMRHQLRDRDLAASRREYAMTYLQQAPVAMVPDRPGVASKEPATVSDRLEALKKEASKGPGGIPLVRPEDLFVDHPTLERTFLAAMRGRTRLKYGPFFAQAGLSEQEIESFCQAYADSETRWTELNKLAFQRGIPRSDPSIQDLERKSSEERKARLAALLGPERSAQLSRYQDEDDSGQMKLGLKNLIATTYHTKDPVTPAQINALLAITTELRVFSPNELADTPGAFDEAATRASRILTPAQMDVFNLILDQQQVSLLRYLELRANRAKP